MTVDPVFQDGYLNGPAEPKISARNLTIMGCILPAAYIEFLHRHNGGAGFLGANYIHLWKAEELVSMNQGYRVEKFAPGLILFGSDGGGEGYGFDMRATSRPVVRIPFIGLDWQDAVHVANGFEEFLFEALTKDFLDESRKRASFSTQNNGN